MVFIIDGSGSIEDSGKGNFQRIKNFVKDVVGGFRIGFDQTHVGAVHYSSSGTAVKILGLEDHYTKAGIDGAINAIVYRAGATFTGEALRLARTQILSAAHDRKDIPNVCIIITDGKADDKIEDPAKELRNSGTTIFAVGVGKNINEQQLTEMAGNESRVFMVQFDNLDGIINQIKESACKGK